MSLLSAIQASFLSLRERVTGSKYKPKDIKDLISYDRPERASMAALESFDVQAELQEARQTATDILERLVKQSEADRHRLEIVFDSLNEALVILNSLGEIRTANLAARTLLGLTCASIGRQFSTILPSVSTAHLSGESHAFSEYLKSIGCKTGCTSCEEKCSTREFKRRYQDFLRTQYTLLNRMMTMQYQRSDGVELSLQTTINVLDLEAFGYTDCDFVVVINDVTPMRLAALEVSRLQSFTVNLMAVSDTPIFYKDADLKFTSVNRAFQDLVNLGAKDILGKSAEAIFEPPSGLQLTMLDHRALRSDHTECTSLDLHTLNGVVRDAKVLSRAVRLGGDTSGIAGSIILNFAFDAKARSALFLAASKAIAFLDHEMRVVGCNDDFLRMTRMTKDAAIGQSGANSSLANFLRTEPTATMSDIITVDATRLGRLCIPIDLDASNKGMVYIYFVHFDEQDSTK